MQIIRFYRAVSEKNNKKKKKTFTEGLPIHLHPLHLFTCIIGLPAYMRYVYKWDCMDFMFWMSIWTQYISSVVYPYQHLCFRYFSWFIFSENLNICLIKRQENNFSRYLEKKKKQDSVLSNKCWELHWENCNGPIMWYLHTWRAWGWR